MARSPAQQMGAFVGLVPSQISQEVSGLTAAKAAPTEYVDPKTISWTDHDAPFGPVWKGTLKWEILPYKWTDLDKLARSFGYY